MNIRTKRELAISAITLAAVVVACSNETTSKAAIDAGQQVLGATLPTGQADAQTPTAKAPKGPAKALPKGTYQLQLLQIPDPTGRMNSPVAARVLVPAGWKGQGGMIWQQAALQECAEYASYAWSATSPDGKSSFELFPNQLWAASNTMQGPCMYGEFQDVQSYLRAYIQQNVQGAQNFQYRQRPDLLEPQRQDLDFQSQLMAGNPNTRFWPDAGELSFAYNDNGTQMKGVIGGTARFYLSQFPNAMGGAPLSSLTGTTISTYAATAPVDSFDPLLVEAMRKSVKPDSTWLYHYSEFGLKLAEQKTGVVKKRSEQIIAAGYALTRATVERNQAAGNAAVAKAYADTPSAGATGGGTDDRSQRERIESLRGVQNNDSYILTNDPNFNPGAYNIDAAQLSVTR